MMIKHLPGPLLLWLALSSFASLGCGEAKDGAHSGDGAAVRQDHDGGCSDKPGSDVVAGPGAPACGPPPVAEYIFGSNTDAGDAEDRPSTCPGPPPICVFGETSGTGTECVACAVAPVRCYVDNDTAFYSCPEGTMDQSGCTCLVPAPDCAGVRCTADGWVCPAGGDGAACSGGG
jgi:hypothetical protein